MPTSPRSLKSMSACEVSRRAEVLYDRGPVSVTLMKWHSSTGARVDSECWAAPSRVSPLIQPAPESH